MLVGDIAWARSSLEALLKRIALALILVPLLLIGCPAEVTTWSNPFDPESIAPAPSLIQGVVVETARDGSGNLIEQPVVGATVTVSRSPQPVAPATTDDGGTFPFDDLPPGEYQLLVTAVGYQPQLSAGDHVLRLHFEDGGVDFDWLELN